MKIVLYMWYFELTKLELHEVVITSASLLPCVGHSGEIGENRTEGNDYKCEVSMYVCVCVCVCVCMCVCVLV